jgi:hypothetical protein
MSVAELPTVWYNRCYLAAAQDSSRVVSDKREASKTMNDFITYFGRPVLTRAVASLQPNPSDPGSAATARQTVLNFIQKF